MRIIVSVHEAYLLFSTLIQPPHHALPVKRDRRDLSVRKNSGLPLACYKKRNHKLYLEVVNL